MAQPRLEVRNLSKTFAGVTVLDKAHLQIEPGEVHALVGQNGSGKSTLIKLISGVYRADPGGDVFVDGRRIGTPVAAGSLHDEGLAFVHQDLGLVPDLSVRDNVRIGRHSINRLTRRINKTADAAAARKSFGFFGLDIDPEAKVRSLRPSERIAVAVARALQDRTPGTGVVVFDESSRAIPHEALDDFYGMIRMLADQGTSVLIVSHDLREVLHIADRVTALRNGRVVEMGAPTSELDEAAITRLVLGRSGELDDYAMTMPSTHRDGGTELRGIRGGRVRSNSDSASATRAARSPVSAGSKRSSKSRTRSTARPGFAASACSMYSTEKAEPIWRRYMAMARRITMRRESRPPRSTRVFSRSLSAAPVQASEKASSKTSPHSGSAHSSDPASTAVRPRSEMWRTDPSERVMA